MLFPSEARAARNGWVAAACVALLLAIAGSSLWAMDQRRRRLDEQLVSRKAQEQANAELDKKIAQRTQSLLLANENLEAKFARLKETELLLRSSQNELVQAGKLNMLGQMAAGVARDLTQPLTSIQAIADNAVTFLSRRQINKAKENLADISAAAARMASVISQLKGFRRASDYPLIKVDLSELVRKAALLLEDDFLRNGVRLEIKIVERAEVVGDVPKIEQVVINLLRNALEAAAAAPVKKVAVMLECAEGNALVHVRDFGAGIPHQVVDHLFEPFFTTKPAGAGLGLGLAISSSIVQAMNGRLTANNHVNGGAEFVLLLPLTATP
jgi:two-component system C4-dicarboxylate transport sensor histidine kinase DctB